MVSCAFPVPVLLLPQMVVLVRAFSPFPGETLFRGVSLQEWEGPQFSGSTAVSLVFHWALSGMARTNSASSSFLSVPTSPPSLSPLLCILTTSRHNLSSPWAFLFLLLSFRVDRVRLLPPPRGSSGLSSRGPWSVLYPPCLSGTRRCIELILPPFGSDKKQVLRVEEGIEQTS